MNLLSRFEGSRDPWFLDSRDRFLSFFFFQNVPFSNRLRVTIIPFFEIRGGLRENSRARDPHNKGWKYSSGIQLAIFGWTREWTSSNPTIARNFRTHAAFEASIVNPFFRPVISLPPLLPPRSNMRRLTKFATIFPREGNPVFSREKTKERNSMNHPMGRIEQPHGSEKGPSASFLEEEVKEGGENLGERGYLENEICFFYSLRIWEERRRSCGDGTRWSQRMTLTLIFDGPLK